MASVRQGVLDDTKNETWYTDDMPTCPTVKKEDTSARAHLSDPLVVYERPGCCYRTDHQDQ